MVTHTIVWVLLPNPKFTRIQLKIHVHFPQVIERDQDWLSWIRPHIWTTLFGQQAGCIMLQVSLFPLSYPLFLSFKIHTFFSKTGSLGVLSLSPSLFLGSKILVLTTWDLYRISQTQYSPSHWSESYTRKVHFGWIGTSFLLSFVRR